MEGKEIKEERHHKRKPHERNESELSETFSDLDLTGVGCFKTPNKSNSYELIEEQAIKSSGPKQGWIAKHRSSSPMVDNIAARFESMLSPATAKVTTPSTASGLDNIFANTKVSSFRQISSLTPDEEYYGDNDGNNYVDTTREDDNNEDKINSHYIHAEVDAGADSGVEVYGGNFKSAYLDDQEKTFQPKVVRARTRSHNSHDQYDNREFHVKGQNLIPAKSQNEYSLSPPSNRDRRSKRIDFKNTMCLPDVENVKRQTRRGLQFIRNKHQRHQHTRSNSNNYQGRKSKKKNRNKGSTNDLTAYSGNTDDFSLRNNGYKSKHHSLSYNRKLNEMDIMSDMSDNDPQDERADHFMRPMLSAPFAHHIPRAVEVVLNVGRHVSNGYGQVAQIMEAHTSSNSIDLLARAASESVDTEVESANELGANQSSSMERGISEITLERHCPNFSHDEDEDGVSSVTMPLDQSYKDFIKKGVKILKEQSSPGVNINDSIDEQAIFSRGLEFESAESGPPILRPQFTRPGIPVPPPPLEFDALSQSQAPPPASVKDRVKAYEVQNKLESKLASGSQGPSIPRSSPIRSSIQAKMPPAQCFAKFLPTKHNDTLKVLFMSSPHSEATKTSLVHKLSMQRKKKLSEANTVDVNVYNWEPQGSDTSAGDLDILAFGARKPTKFRLFDLKGGNIENGSHASQFLFFSPNSLYVIVWDMAVHNDKAATPNDEDECESAFDRRKRDKVKNRAINFDIDENVLYWLDVIDELNFPGSVIMPVVLASNELGEKEMDNRCSMLKKRLLNHRKDAMILFDSDKVPIVNLDEEDSLDAFRRTIISLGSESSVFENHFKQLSPAAVRTEEAISLFKSKEYNVVHFKELYLEISKRQGDNFSEEHVRQALDFLASIGEIVYFGNDITECSCPHLLKRFIILNPKWISDAIAPVLCQEEICDVRKTFDGTVPSSLGQCFRNLFVTDFETVQIWEQIDYVYEHNKLGAETDNEELFYFLQQVCEHCGIFIPITIPNAIGQSISYLLPRVTAEPSSSSWTFTTNNRYKTIIGHSWLIREALPITFMDVVSAAVVNALIKPDPRIVEPYVTTHVEQIMCYKTAMYVKVVEIVRAERPTKTINELYICLAHANSRNCVSSGDMRNTDRKLMVCGKGFEGRFGEKIWKLGYDSILKTVSDVIRNHTKGDFSEEIACPGCLIGMAPREVPCWRMDTVESQPAEEKLRCNNHRNVHMILPQLLRGEECDDDDCSVISTATGYTACTAWSSISHSTATTCVTCDTHDRTPGRGVPEMLPSIVLVSLWDTRNQRIVSTGSGFIADKRRGLIVTAGHVFYSFENNTTVGEKFFGIEGAIAIVSIYDSQTETANFQYTADIVVHDLEKADCCILRLKEKFENPIATNGFHISYPQAMTFSLNVATEGLAHLPLADSVELETNIRVIGYNQEGEGLHNDDEIIDRSPCYDSGHVLKKMAGSGTIARNPNDPIIHCPQSEVVIKSRTKFGHSGGPCVNSNGEVIGIVSRSDPIEEDRNYLAPSTIIMSLLKKAQRKVDAKQTRNRVRFNTATSIRSGRKI